VVTQKTNHLRHCEHQRMDCSDGAKQSLRWDRFALHTSFAGARDDDIILGSSVNKVLLLFLQFGFAS